MNICHAHNVGRVLIIRGKEVLPICEASFDTIKKAHATHPIVAVQTEYSLWSRDCEELIDDLEELKIGFVNYSPLGRGFLTGTINSFNDLSEKDGRRGHPRFAPDNMKKNSADHYRSLAGRSPCTFTPAKS